MRDVVFSKRAAAAAASCETSSFRSGPFHELTEIVQEPLGLFWDRFPNVVCEEMSQNYRVESREKLSPILQPELFVQSKERQWVLLVDLYALGEVSTDALRK